MTSPQLYSAMPAQRTRQIIADVLAVAVIVVSIVLGSVVGALIGSLAALGESVESAGNGFQTTMADAADALSGLPLVGSGVSSPFQSASDAGATLASAGQQGQQLIGTVALGAGIVVAAVPILVVLLLWLRPRIRFVRRAGTARSLAGSEGGMELLALGALVRSRPAALLALTPDPVAAWRAGDPDTVRALAALELRQAGVQVG